MVDVLYLTQDGITDHIGQAQIAPYLLGLARLGHRIHVVSAEKTGRAEIKRKYRELFDAAGIAWSTVPYANKPPLISSAWVMLRMYLKAREIMSRERQQLIHCRSYLPLELAVMLKRRFGAKLLVDFRDFWADVGLEKKPFKFVFRFLKRREPDYLGSADHVVTLTRRAADVLMGWYPTAVGGDPSKYTVIPCCADFSLFDRKRIDPARAERLRRELQLGKGPVLLYLGSIGHDYLLGDMLDLFRELRSLQPSAQFLFVSNNARESLIREAAARDFPADAFRFASVDRPEVPEYASLADLSVVFIRPTLSKAGCSPTKLAELFALDIPVIANSGVGDMDSIVDLERNGSVIVPDFEPATLRRAIQRVLTRSRAEPGLIREQSREFSLDQGIVRYDRIYQRLSKSVEESCNGSEACSC